MKNFKAIKILSILVISLFIVNVNVKAFENTHDITYDFIYNNVVLKAQEDDSNFSFEEYDKFICSPVNSELYCWFIKGSDLNKIDLNYTKYVNLNKLEDFKFYYIYTNKTFSYTIVRLNDFSSTYFSANVYTNIKDYKDITNVIYLDSGLEEPELEITATGTEILTSILDKTKNIYEVLIANQLFVLCSCILLSYLVFIILYKIIRK